ncbi:MAG: hypothetical protein COT90_02020 [Candidatus Diapherotrites archaeon CG10_big_fil_rev_8_21_14_0_10_31_34]|nr:MAG: hypothetical protein COT90_02020 [Candidatus Diapherotrites archaeon CG10_big_fil_rev_8_21_14_0_10_31_34]
MKLNKSNLILTAGVLIATFVFIYVLSFLSYYFMPQRPMGMRAFFEDFILIKTVIFSVNTVLLVYLIYNYVSLYNEVKSQFSLGLITMSLALFSFAVTDNPLFPLLFGLRGAGMGALTIIPSLFTLVAVLVLIYLSRK